MKRSIEIWRLAAIVLAYLYATVPARGQTAAEDTGASNKRFLIGFRMRYLPVPSLSAMANGSLLTTTTTPAPVRDWSFSTASQSWRWGAGPRVELTAGRKWKVTAEILWTRLKYTKSTTVAWGTDDPNTNNDERSHLFRTEDTRANLWDLPLLVQYSGFSGKWSRFYVTGGGAVRTVTGIHSTLNTTFPDTSTSTVQYVQTPSKRNVLGGVIGAGFRIVDDFNIHWTPEIRYTRWAGSTFSTDSTVSPKNQLEVGFGFTF